MNQFHWHVVDSQSFPLQIPEFMDLSIKGAYSSSSVYTPDDVKDIVAYAGAVRLFSSYPALILAYSLCSDIAWH